MRVFWTNIGFIFLLVATGFLGWGILPAKGDTVWENGVEAGFPAEASWTGLWTVQVSSLSAHTGSRGVNVVGPSASGGDNLWFNLSSTGYENLVWEYQYKIRNDFEVGDWVTAKWSSDGGQTWLPLATYTELAAGDWQLASFTLPAAANNQPSLLFDFEANLSGSTDRGNFDEFRLSGVLTPEPATLFLLGLGSLFLRRRV